MSAFLLRLLAFSARATAVMMISSRVSLLRPGFSKISVFLAIRAIHGLRLAFLESTRMTEWPRTLSRFQNHVPNVFFESDGGREVGSKAQCLRRRELISTVSRPLMLSWMSEVVKLWKRMVPTGNPVLQRVTVRRGLLDKKAGKWTASLLMARTRA